MHQLGRETVQRVAQETGEAMVTGESDTTAGAFGRLLWAVEVRLGSRFRAPVSRFYLGRQAARDPLAAAVRTVVGLKVPLHSPAS